MCAHARDLALCRLTRATHRARTTCVRIPEPWAVVLDPAAPRSWAITLYIPGSSVLRKTSSTLRGRGAHVSIAALYCSRSIATQENMVSFHVGCYGRGLLKEKDAAPVPIMPALF